MSWKNSRDGTGHRAVRSWRPQAWHGERDDLEHCGLEPTGAYRGMVFAADLGLATRCAFCELPLLVVD